MTWVRPHVCYKALVALTPATVGLSFPRMGTAWHLAVGLAFGTVNAALVVLVFVHLIRSQAWT